MFYETVSIFNYQFTWQTVVHFLLCLNPQACLECIKKSTFLNLIQHMVVCYLNYDGFPKIRFIKLQ